MSAEQPSPPQGNPTAGERAQFGEVGGDVLLETPTPFDRALAEARNLHPETPGQALAAAHEDARQRFDTLIGEEPAAGPALTEVRKIVYKGQDRIQGVSIADHDIADQMPDPAELAERIARFERSRQEYEDQHPGSIQGRLEEQLDTARQNNDPSQVRRLEADMAYNDPDQAAQAYGRIMEELYGDRWTAHLNATGVENFGAWLGEWNRQHPSESSQETNTGQADGFETETPGAGESEPDTENPSDSEDSASESAGPEKSGYLSREASLLRAEATFLERRNIVVDRAGGLSIPMGAEKATFEGLQVSDEGELTVAVSRIDADGNRHEQRLTFDELKRLQKGEQKPEETAAPDNPSAIEAPDASAEDETQSEATSPAAEQAEQDDDPEIVEIERQTRLARIAYGAGRTTGRALGWARNVRPTLRSAANMAALRTAQGLILAREEGAELVRRGQRAAQAVRQRVARR